MLNLQLLLLLLLLLLKLCCWSAAQYKAWHAGAGPSVVLAVLL
jgi:hypothetical protein